MPNVAGLVNASFSPKKETMAKIKTIKKFRSVLSLFPKKELVKKRNTPKIIASDPKRAKIYEMILTNCRLLR